LQIYACATATKATIKTARFAFNGSEGLNSLGINSIGNAFAGDVEQALWGVKTTSRKYRLDQILLLRGILDTPIKVIQIYQPFAKKRYIFPV